MWLTTTIGDYSIAQISDEPEDPLMVRARTRDDLDTLREYLPELTEIEEDSFADYVYWAWCPKEALTSGLEQMILQVEAEEDDEQVELLF